MHLNVVFLQPKWNNALLEMFRIDYIGTSPYINCLPSVYHHQLGPRDRFLILSSDGLYQYFTNEEAVSEVELFISWSPEGDPAQHLVEELLFRAAKRAGIYSLCLSEKLLVFLFRHLKKKRNLILHYVLIQAWIFTNCSKYHKGTDVDTMMMCR